MDIKLRAKLSAYSLVDTFEPTDSEHSCKLMTPVTTQQIDDYLFGGKQDTSPDDVIIPDNDFANFVDSLFKEE